MMVASPELDDISPILEKYIRTYPSRAVISAIEKEKNPTERETLTNGEMMMIELFRQIPEEQQRIFLEMGKAYANSLKKG